MSSVRELETLMTMPTESWLTRAIERPASMDHIVRWFLDFLCTTAQYHLHAPRGVFDEVREHLDWARQQNDTFVPQFFFFSLYAHFEEVRSAVNRIEMKACAGISLVTLAPLGNCIQDIIAEAQMHNFCVENIAQVSASIRDAMALVAAARSPVVIAFPGFDEKNYIDKKNRRESCPVRYATMHAEMRHKATAIEKLARQLSTISADNPQRLVIDKRACRQHPFLAHVSFYREGKRRRVQDAMKEIAAGLHQDDGRDTIVKGEEYEEEETEYV